MNAVLAHGLLGIVILGLAGMFAAAFGSSTDAQRSVGRIRGRVGPFRVGGVFIVAGVAFTAQADSIIALAGLPRDDPRFTTPVVVGYVLIVAGMAVLDTVLWWPPRPDVST